MCAAGNRPEAVELFMSDHQTVQEKLEKLEKIFLQLKDDMAIPGKADITFLWEMADIFDTELVVHFQREEKALFPVMEKYVPRDEGPVGVMLEEHEKIFEIIDAFKDDVETLSEAEGLSEVSLEDAAYNTHTLIETLRGHIDKEDNMLLSTAESHLKAEDWSSVWQEMEKITLQTMRTILGG